MPLGDLRAVTKDLPKESHKIRMQVEGCGKRISDLGFLTADVCTKEEQLGFMMIKRSGNIFKD